MSEALKLSEVYSFKAAWIQSIHLINAYPDSYIGAFDWTRTELEKSWKNLVAQRTFEVGTGCCCDSTESGVDQAFEDADLELFEHVEGISRMAHAQCLLRQF